MIMVIVLDISFGLLQPCDPTPMVIGDGVNIFSVIEIDISICLLQPCDPTPLVIGDGEANDNGDCT